MIRSGDLMGSLTSLTGPPNDIGRTSASFGTDVEYARFHQSGTRHMPARKVVYEPIGFARQFGSRAADWIVDGVID
jgi:phage gpG-like protein